MSVEISDALARDLLWWLQNADVPYNDGGYLTRYRFGNRVPTQMELARDSMVDELLKAMKQAEGKK